jgi:hypothetical protein
MNEHEFKAWRDRTGLTQQGVAERLNVTRTTIQNWEGGVTAIPQAVEMSCQLWEDRLKQENPDLGPVTLIYSDGPMFVDPYGPRRRPSMMQQEPYPTNTAALARVQQLWGRDDFHNVFIIEKSGKPVWNIVELGRVVSGEDTNAPTVGNLLKAIAKSVRANSKIFARGLKTLTLEEVNERQRTIEAQANELERFAAQGLVAIFRDRLLIERVFKKLLELGTKAPDGLVSNVHQALAVLERYPMFEDSQPRLQQGGYVIDYKGYEITYPKVPMFSNQQTVNLCSDNPHLLNKLGGRTVVINAANLEGAIAEAKRRVDAIG